jgi:hypothetical protein
MSVLRQSAATRFNATKNYTGSACFIRTKCEQRLQHVVDTGSDMSVLRQSAATRFNATITGSACFIRTKCEQRLQSARKLIVVLPSATLDAIIGWDIIGLPHLKVVKTDDGLELHHDLLNSSKVLTVKNNDLNNINVSGLDEQCVARLIQLLRLE